MSKRPVNVKMMIWKWYLPFTAILGTTTINHFWVAGIFPMSRVVVLNQSCWQDTTSTSNRASWGLFWLTASMSLRIENYRPSIIILIMVIDTVLNYWVKCYRIHGQLCYYDILGKQQPLHRNLFYFQRNLFCNSLFNKLLIHVLIKQFSRHLSTQILVIRMISDDFFTYIPIAYYWHLTI